MSLLRKINNMKRLMALLPRISLGQMLVLLEKAMQAKPVVGFKENESTALYGLQNDYIFEVALTHGLSGNEMHFEESVKLLLTPGCNCLDLGANIGTHSLAMAELAVGGNVYAFEPQSLMFSLLQANIFANGIKNIKALKFAVGEKDNVVISMDALHYLDGDLQTNSGGLRVDHGDLTLGDLALSRRIDSFSFPKITFVKMDIQGAELEALRGAKDLIKRDRPILFIEIEENHLTALGASSEELIEMVFSLGYVLYRIHSSYPCDHLCIPEESVEEFENHTLPRFDFKTSKLAGTRVRLFFDASVSKNNYESFEIIA